MAGVGRYNQKPRRKVRHVTDATDPDGGPLVVPQANVTRVDTRLYGSFRYAPVRARSGEPTDRRHTLFYRPMVRALCRTLRASKTLTTLIAPQDWRPA